MSGFAELSIAASAARSARPAVALALATLVGVEGSSFRQPGARLLVDAEGRVLAGAISGGCLEGDVAARAEAVCASGTPTVLTYDLRNDLETIWGFGSACDGVATVLLEPLADAHWLGVADTVRRSRRGGAIVTHVGHDAAPSLATIAIADGRELRAPNGGAFDAVADGPDEMRDATMRDATMRDAIVRGVAIAERTARAHVEPVSGGTLFMDPLIAPIALHVVGAGRGAEAFARIAVTLGWEVTVVDHRPQLLDGLVLPAGVRVRTLRAEDASAPGAASFTTDGRTAVALLTHIFDADVAWLAHFARSTVAYIGVLGSRQRAAKLMEQLSNDGAALTPSMLARVHAPIGLDLGGESPESIALAAIAEIEAVMHARPGGALRERQSPIHERTPVPSTIAATVKASTRAIDASCQLPRD